MHFELSQLLKEKRKSLGLSVKFVLERLQSYGISISDKTFYGWESGYRQPDSDTFVVLCDIYGIDSLSYFAGNAKNSPSISDEALRIARDYDLLDRHGREIVESVLNIEFKRCAKLSRAEDEKFYVMPCYLSAMSAGTGEISTDEYPEDYILKKRPPRGASYIAPVHGDSMEPTIHDGDKLFIRACTEIRPGKIGVFFMDGKMWVKELGEGVLISHNEKYPPITMTEGILCQGEVLGVCDESYFE